MLLRCSYGTTLTTHFLVLPPMSSLPPRPSRSGSTPGTFSADAYYAMQPAPEDLEMVVHAVEGFIAQQIREGRRVVLVTVSRHTSGRLLTSVKTWSSLSHHLLYHQEIWVLTSFLSAYLAIVTFASPCCRAVARRSPWSSTCETELSQPCISMREER